MPYRGEFEKEGFRLIRGPKWNKKERRRLGLAKQDPKIIIFAKGFFHHNGKRRYMQKTSEITTHEFADGYFHFKTKNGSSYKVPYINFPSLAKEISNE